MKVFVLYASLMILIATWFKRKKHFKSRWGWLRRMMMVNDPALRIAVEKLKFRLYRKSYRGDHWRLGSPADFTITSTAHFDAGTPSVSDRVVDIETETDNPKVAAGELQVASMNGDSFEYASEDAMTWKWRHEKQGLGVGSPTAGLITADINITTSGKLHLAITGAAANGDHEVRSQNVLTGDFDIQAKIDCVLPSTANGFIIFGVQKKSGTRGDTSNAAYVRRYYDGTHTLEGRTYPGGVLGTLGSTDDSFSVRMTRSGTTVELFYDIAQGESWTSLGSRALAGLGDCSVVFGLTTSVGYPDVAMDVDDWKVNSGSWVDGAEVGSEPVSHFNDFYDNRSYFDLPGGTNGEAVHPDVLYFPAGEDGYKFWLYYTPMPSTYEFVSLVRSNDGETWVEDGVSNPILEERESGWGSGGNKLLADPDVVKVGSNWYLYFTGKDVVSGFNEIGYATSSDGKSWTFGGPCITEADFETATGQDIDSLTSPSVVYRTSNTTFYLYFCVSEVGGAHNSKTVVYYATSPDGTTYTVQSGRLLIPGGPGEWYSGDAFHHINVWQHSDGNLYMVGHSFDGLLWRYKIGVAVSSDYTSWTRSNRSPILNGDEDDWDEWMYRAALIEVDGEEWLYYSAYENGGSPEFHISLVKSKSPSWTSAAQTMPEKKKLKNTTLTHSGLSSSAYIDCIEWLIDDVVIAAHDTDIASGSSTLITKAESGNFNQVNEDFTIKLYLVAGSSPVITQIEGDYKGRILDSENPDVYQPAFSRRYSGRAGSRQRDRVPVDFGGKGI